MKRTFYYEFEQGSDEWYKIRSGCITGSGFKNLITQKWGRGAQTYVDNIIHVLKTGESDLQHFSNAATEWGNEQEPYAARAYRYTKLTEVALPAFVKVHPLVGCSPDFITQTGNVLGEIKCYYTKGKVLAREGKIEKVYVPQCNFNAAICGCTEFDYVTFDPRNNNGEKLFIERHKVDKILLRSSESRINRAINQINSELLTSFPMFKFDL
tara:strand:+ start:1845 stop:2477 length:633 start_codon:yes stop_codon:yes gene_type:complete